MPILLYKLKVFRITAAILAVLAVAKVKKIPLDVCCKALSKIRGIPGRFEIIQENQNFGVIVDYAHTPVSLENVYKAARVFLNDQNNKLICVLGSAGGGRDKWKRKEFGRLAGIYCNTIILTNEDPYDEKPNSIINDIKSGILGAEKDVFEVIDRKQAINKALKMAQNGDVVIITGKGCEPWMMIENNKKIPWDDRAIVRELLMTKE